MSVSDFYPSNQSSIYENTYIQICYRQTVMAFIVIAYRIKVPTFVHQDHLAIIQHFQQIVAPDHQIRPYPFN